MKNYNGPKKKGGGFEKNVKDSFSAKTTEFFFWGGAPTIFF